MQSQQHSPVLLYICHASAACLQALSTLTTCCCSHHWETPSLGRCCRCFSLLVWHNTVRNHLLCCQLCQGRALSVYIKLSLVGPCFAIPYCHQTCIGVIRHALVSSDRRRSHQTCLGASRGLGSVQYTHLLQHVHASWRSLAGAVCGQQGALHAASQSPAAPFGGRPGCCREWREPAAAGNLAGQFLGLQTCQSRYGNPKHGLHPCWRSGPILHFVVSGVLW